MPFYEAQRHSALQKGSNMTVICYSDAIIIEVVYSLKDVPHFAEFKTKQHQSIHFMINSDSDVC